MYLNCQNCDTSFVIDKALLAPNGKKLKCSQCSHVWYQEYNTNFADLTVQSEKPEKKQEIKQPNTQQQNTIVRPGFVNYNLPAVIKHTNSTNTNYILYFSIVFIILYFIFLYFVYSFFGLVKSDVDLLDVKLAGIIEDKFENKIFLKYQISNIDDIAKNLPIACVTFFNDTGNPIFSTQIDTQDVILESQHYIYITSEFAGLIHQVHALAITFKCNY